MTRHALADAPTVQALISQVWTTEVTRHADVALFQDEHGYYVRAFRHQGDLALYATERIRRRAWASAEANPGALARELDRAISATLRRFRPLTISDALVAGESRRLWLRERR